MTNDLVMTAVLYEIPITEEEAHKAAMAICNAAVRKGWSIEETKEMFEAVGLRSYKKNRRNIKRSRMM